MGENMKRIEFLKRAVKVALLPALAVLLVIGVNMAQAPLTPLEELGSFLYFDEDLSEPAGQSCASCHEPAVGFDDPDEGLPVSEGVIPGLFGGAEFTDLGLRHVRPGPLLR